MVRHVRGVEVWGAICKGMAIVTLIETLIDETLSGNLQVRKSAIFYARVPSVRGENSSSEKINTPMRLIALPDVSHVRSA